MTKEEMIKNLKNVKLVIGNGYDLHCGLKSSYGDFFMHDTDKYNFINRQLNDIKVIIMKNNFNNIQFDEDFFTELGKIDMLNVWELFFHMKAKIAGENNKEKMLWCDIETVMYKSLDIHDDNVRNYDLFKWEYVYDAFNKLLSKKSVNNGIIPIKLYNWEVQAIAMVIIKKRNNEKFIDINDFYYYILKELKEFEKEFGEFISNQRSEKINYLYKMPHPYFENRSKITLDKLCNLDNLVSIDSFNYDDIGIEELNKILHNINGNLNNPIFGVDSNLCSASNPLFIFTKTNRRMELEMINYECQNDIAFENVIVFGHSLSPNDYSYFFPILDKLEMTNFLSNKKIVFGFCVFNKDREVEIKRNNRLNIQKLFEAYANYKGLKDTNRLLDSLTTQNRVLTYEIETFI